MPRLATLLLILCAGLCAALLWGTYGVVGPATGGLMPMDLRVTGYGPAEVRAFLGALDAGARDFLLGPMRIVDTAFPPALAALIVVLGPGRAGLLRLSRLAALAYALVDLAENAVVAGLIRGGADTVTEETVRLASTLTLSKFALLTLAVLALALGRRVEPRPRAR